jgi:hypothetical protein
MFCRPFQSSRLCCYKQDEASKSNALQHLAEMEDGQCDDAKEEENKSETGAVDEKKSKVKNLPVLSISRGSLVTFLH